MMTIGIIGAMQVEIDELKASIDIEKSENISGVEFLCGNYEDKKIVAAVSGVGKVFAAICAQTMILKFGVDILINIGVAGTLTNRLSILDTALASEVVQHDMDTTPLGDPPGLLSGINIVKIPCDKKILSVLEKSAAKLNFKTETGTIASGDCFVESAEKKDYIKNTFGAIAVEMEGASIGHVCYVNKTPFCVLRAISDGADCTMDYNTFVVRAAAVSTAIILNFLKEYK